MGALIVGLGLGFVLNRVISPPTASRTPLGSHAGAQAILPGERRGYLTDQALDSTRLLAPPPKSGSLGDKHDRETFLATRALKGSARWALAKSDDDQSLSATLADFSCAAGVELTPAAAPALASLITNATPDEMRVVNAAKVHFARRRPFLVDPGDICVPRTSDLVQSPDYPSGHATWGWMVGLILAEIVPDRATEILARARAYGDSRVVCGAHNESAVTAGETNAAGLVAALHASPDFRADLEMAHAELESVRRAGAAPSAAKCSQEANALATP